MSSRPKLNIYCIGAAPLITLARKKGYKIYAISLANINKALAKKTYIDPATKVPSEYHDLLVVFSQEKSEQLLTRRPYDHKIKLVEGKQYSFGPLYEMSWDELKVLRKYLEENLLKGLICASLLLVASPVIFVKKPGGSLQFCVDYRALNAVTVKN